MNGITLFDNIETLAAQNKVDRALAAAPVKAPVTFATVPPVAWLALAAVVAFLVWK